MIKITLNQILAKNPCADGWAKILHARGKITDQQMQEAVYGGCAPKSYEKLADDEEFPLSLAIESNGLSDTLWSLRCLPDDYRLWRKYAVWCARQVQHLMKDQRSINALDVAWRHSDGLATEEELKVAKRGADAAASASDEAAADSAYVAYAAAAANADDFAFTYAIDAAASAYADDADAMAEARKKQEAKLLQILEAGHWVDDK